MLRSLAKTVRPALVCMPVRNVRAKPVYYNPADADPVEEQKFNEEFGLAEPVKDTWGDSKYEDWCWVLDPFYKAKKRVGQA